MHARTNNTILQVVTWVFLRVLLARVTRYDIKVYDLNSGGNN